MWVLPPPTTPVTEVLKHAVENVPGWTPLDELLALFSIALSSSHLEGDIVEIGSWCGRSAVALGLAARVTGHTRLHCIDLFPERDDWKRNADGSYSMTVRIGDIELGAYNTQTVWREPFERYIAPLYQRHRSILDIFLETIAAYDLGDVVRYYRGSSDVLLSQPNVARRCRLAFIDGDHGYDAVRRDIASVEQILLPGGWICFDDAFTTYEGVDRAVRHAVVENSSYDLKLQVSRKLFIARRAITQK